MYLAYPYPNAIAREIASPAAIVEAVAESTVAEASEEDAEEVVAKEALGWNIGGAASVGLLKGETFTEVPTGGTIVLTTPFGFKIGPLDYTVSIGFGSYTGEHQGAAFDPAFVGLGGNLTLADFVFAEGHVGTVGEGTGIRGFAGVTLERLLKNNLNLPFNLLLGSEIFYSTDMSGAGNSSGWAALGLRLDVGF